MRHTPTVRSRLLLPVIAVAMLAQPGATQATRAHTAGHAATIVPSDLASCVRSKRAVARGTTYLEGVVRCVDITRMEATTVVRWSTCAGGGAFGGEYPCETGSARVSIRATRATREFRPPPAGWPRGAQRWHLYGDGTASCSRVSHGLTAGGRAASREDRASGRINHVDFAVLWPSIPADGTLAVGVSPLWRNPLPDTLADAIVRPRACRAVFALDALVPRARRGLSVADLLATGGVTARLRDRFLFGLGTPLSAAAGPLVGRPLVVEVDTRLSAAFATGG